MAKQESILTKEIRQLMKALDSHITATTEGKKETSKDFDRHFAENALLIYTIINTVFLTHIIKELYPNKKDLAKTFLALYEQSEDEIRLLLSSRFDAYSRSLLRRGAKRTWLDFFEGQKWVVRKKKK